MKLFITILAFTIGSLNMFSNADAQDAEAAKIHTDLKGLYDEIGKDLGFKTEDELRSSTLGKPIKVYMAGLDDLEKFNSGDDPSKLLSDTKEVIYPIYSGDKIKSSLTLVQRDGKWELASFGGGEAILAEASRTKNMEADGREAGDYMVVKMPAMLQTFVGYKDGDKMSLIPCHDNDQMNLKADEPMPAESVVLSMKPHIEKFKTAGTVPGDTDTGQGDAGQEEMDTGGEYTIEIVSKIDPTWNGGGMGKPMGIRIKDASGEYIKDLEKAGLTIEASSNNASGKTDGSITNRSSLNDDDSQFQIYYFIPADKVERPSTVQIDIAVKKAGRVVGSVSLEHEFKE